MKTKGLMTLVALCIGSLSLGGDIYTGNCDATNAAVKSKRTCYTCCNDQNGTSTETANCQNSCDQVWKRTAPDWMPQDFIAYMFDTRNDWRAQLDILSDDQLWEWFVAGDGEDQPVPIFVVEIVDWLFANAADITVERMAIVQLSWLKADYGLSPDGDDLVNAVLMDALASEDLRVRRSALYGMQDTKAFVSNPAILVEMIRVTAQDPDQSVRDVGFQILADR